MTDILNEINKEIYIASAGALAGAMVTKIFDLLYPDTLIFYVTQLCVQKPKELRATEKLPQIFELDKHRSEHLGYKKYIYGRINEYDWKISVPDDAVDKQTKINIYTTISNKPENDYHYFYYKIRYNNTDDPKVTAFCRRFHYDNYIDPVSPTNKTKKINTHCLENNVITGKYFFESKINQTYHGGEIGTEHIGLEFGEGPGEYIIEEAYISDKQINIKKCGFTYLFYKFYNKKPEFVTNSP